MIKNSVLQLPNSLVIAAAGHDPAREKPVGVRGPFFLCDSEKAGILGCSQIITNGFRKPIEIFQKRFHRGRLGMFLAASGASMQVWIVMVQAARVIATSTDSHTANG